MLSRSRLPCHVPDFMKTELPIIAALGLALAYTGGKSNTACGPGGCWMMPPEFDKAAETLRDDAAKILESRTSDERPTFSPAPADAQSAFPNPLANAPASPAASE